MTHTTEPLAIDVHSLLADRGQIADIWSIEDVQSVRPDLTDEQAWQTLLSVQRNHNAEFGICWDVLEAAAESLFGLESSNTASGRAS